MPSQGRKKKLPKSRPARGRRGRRLGILLLAVLLLAAAFGAAGAYFLNLDLPDVRSLADYRPATTTRLVAADGSLVHEFATERRTVITYSEIPPVLRNAIVATEDSNFFKHVGVDPIGIARALVRDVLSLSKAEGASTLTQQLARGLFLKPDKTFRRKIREATLAMQIEKTYTKEEIFTFYSNQTYLGHGYYGVEAASQFYFGRRARDLTLPQAAMIAGLIQRPEAISPLRNLGRALQRRNHVLERMRGEGYITAKQREAASREPLELAPPRFSATSAVFFIEEVRRDLDARLGQDALFRSGLTIETGLDLALQRQSEGALDRGLREIAKRRAFRLPASNILRDKKGALDGYRHPDWTRPPEAGAVVTGLVMDVDRNHATVRIGESRFEVAEDAIAWTGRGSPERIFRPGDLAPFLVKEAGGRLALELSAAPTCDGAVIAMDPGSGEIRALVGGLDFNRSQWDKAIQATRQPGSAFKPIIYAAALEEGWRATDLLLDEPTVFVDPQTRALYQPENYYREYEGIVTVRHALEHSLNVPTIRMLNQIGYERAVAQARRMGITSSLRPYPALGLGASEVTLIDLVTAYAVFPNLGTRVQPRLHTRIRQADGTVAEESKPVGTDAMRPDVAFLMTSLLKGVIARGTAMEAASLGEEIAGKTGTTDDNTDAWFVGYSPSLVLGVWVGKDDKEPIGTNETGAVAALPIWIDIMRTWLAARPGETFKRPSGIEAVPIDPSTGLKAGVDTGCAQVIMEDLRRGDPEPAKCTREAHLRARLPYYLQRFPRIDEGTIALTQTDLARILRENSQEVAPDGKDRLVAQTASGPVTVTFKIVPVEDPALLSVAGAAALSGFTAFPGGKPVRDDFFSLVYPADLTSLPGDASAHPTVGLDGRAAAVLTIRYP